MADSDIPPRVAHGDRRGEVWIEDDKGQLSKVRHTWPAGAPLQRGQGEALKADGRAKLGEVTDAAVVPDEPSAWEAVEEGD